MAFSEYAYRDGSGYYKVSDESGPYWLDDSGVGTLLSTSWPTVAGASTSPLYHFRSGAGWFRNSTGAGPYTSS